MSFCESPRFPDWIAAWAAGGRRFNVSIVQTYGGNEYRNKPWVYGLGRWTFQNALSQTNGALTYGHVLLRNFLMGSYGEWGGFRFQALNDNADEGQGVLGTGVALASTLVYQMYKNYPIGAGTTVGQGIILKPVVGATRIYNNGVLQLLGTAYTIDESTGIVTFLAQPTVGHTLTWTGSFDIPVRFDGDAPQIGLDDGGTFFDWQNMALVELRNP